MWWNPVTDQYFSLYFWSSYNFFFSFILEGGPFFGKNWNGPSVTKHWETCELISNNYVCSISDISLRRRQCQLQDSRFCPLLVLLELCASLEMKFLRSLELETVTHLRELHYRPEKTRDSLAVRSRQRGWCHPNKWHKTGSGSDWLRIVSFSVAMSSKS